MRMHTPVVLSTEHARSTLGPLSTDESRCVGLGRRSPFAALWPSPACVRGRRSLGETVSRSIDSHCAVWLSSLGSQEAARSIRHMDMTFLVPLFAAFLVPATRGLALEVLHLWLDARSIMRELLTPLRARRKARRSSSTAHKASPLSGSEAARLGFGLVVCSLLHVPLLGPFAWFLAFVAAGLAAPELVDLNSFDDRPNSG
ncbi:hypothetical protein PsorP6_013168 [Peronosclerospora sorghi]|uniref:Uncharacterized protein n=1 Tax=Peronosclerospora sorghi TaxID=230839 RepID=A0ACC0WGE0_9STRA|nr:hypothetical protein PsorP6_013168 [Peronosclerospora sorghi]